MRCHIRRTTAGAGLASDSSSFSSSEEEEEEEAEESSLLELTSSSLLRSHTHTHSQPPGTPHSRCAGPRMSAGIWCLAEVVRRAHLLSSSKLAAFSTEAGAEGVEAAAAAVRGRCACVRAVPRARSLRNDTSTATEAAP